MKQIPEEIMQMVDLARTGDALMVRSTTFFGLAIRCMLSRGPHRCISNHNQPVWRLTNHIQPKTLKIEPPAASIVGLTQYLLDLYEAGGRAILVRPDAYIHESPLLDRARREMIDEWTAMKGKKYDKHSIQMILRMYLRKSDHVSDNDKTQIYCTEGDLAPKTGNTILPWIPDILKNEKYPAPIHYEHLLRQGRVIFVAGNDWMHQKILSA